MENKNNSNVHRKEKMTEAIRKAAAEFIEHESNHQSLITVTKVEISHDFKKSVISVTVFPEDKEDTAIEFLKRQLHEFRSFAKEKTRLSYIPWFSFEIDAGEKNRQRIDELI